MPKDQREGQATILEANELEKLCNSFPMGQHRVISFVCTFTSCRISEALSLKFRNIKKDYILFKAKDTKTNEQRSTEWMGFESLENFLADDNTTIEGLPAPLRAVFIAEKK